MTALLLFMCLLLLPLSGLALSGAVYEVFVASFYDADGDGMGDLRGVAEKIPYIVSLGAKAVWLMPVSPSPSYHKYDVTDYCAVAPEYGTMEDFDLLADTCHENGLSLIVDLVLNHTSSEHPWFKAACEALREGKDSEYISYYQFRKGSGEYVVTGTDRYYHSSFGYHMPDLNLDNENVRNEIKQIISFWLSHGADGFRLDATSHYYESNTAKNTEFLSFVNETVKSEKPDAYVVGEAWTDDSVILSLYQSGVDSFFAFSFTGGTGTLIDKIRNGDGAGLAKIYENWYASIAAANQDAQNAPFLSNHDLARWAGTVRYDQKTEKLSAAVNLLLPGVPYIYYGEELGMSGSGEDENKRLPMLWSAEDKTGECDPPVNATQTQRLTEGADAQEMDENSLLSYYKAVLACRNATPEFDRGTLARVDTGIKAVCAYTVTDGAGSVLVAHNFSKKDAAVFSFEGELIQIFDTQERESAYEGGEITLAPYASIVLRVK